MLGEIFEGIKSFLGDTLTSVLEAVLNATLFKLMYYIEIGMCWIIDQLYSMFRVFAGIDRISYDGKPDYLINVFFSNSTVSNIYWAMALVGIALTFGFLIWSVARKMFDLDGRQQASMGQIVGSGLKSILLIVSMTLVISMVLTTTNQLMETITKIFDEGKHLAYPIERDFTEDEYAAMGRVLSVIGNASMVPTSDNRYNVNLCYNEIRGDMLYLQTKGVFMYSYYQTDKNGNEIKSWQSILSDIAHSTDLRYDVKIDVYNQGVMESITKAMNYLQSGGTIVPVAHVSDLYKSDGSAHLDRMIFLMGTLRAARNGYYNQSPSLTDALRAPYYYEQGRSIYNFDDVDDDFNIGFPTDYIVVFIAGVAAIVDLLTIILNCVARIFNMLFLYIIAPPIIAASPLDGGGKFKQWTTAFIVQSMSVFGTVIAMRLLMIYLPIVISPQLVMFPDKPMLDALAKFLLIFGGFEAAKKSTSLLTGILADSAGWQAVQAGDMSGSAGRMLGGITGAARAVGGVGLKAGLGVANFATKPVQNVAKRGWDATGGKLAESWMGLGSNAAEKKAANTAREQLAVEAAKAKMTGGGGPNITPSAKNFSGGSNSGTSSLPSANKGNGGGPKMSTPPPLNRGGSKEAPASIGHRPTLDSFGSGGGPLGSVSSNNAQDSLPSLMGDRSAVDSKSGNDASQFVQSSGPSFSFSGGGGGESIPSNNASTFSAGSDSPNLGRMSTPPPLSRSGVGGSIPTSREAPASFGSRPTLGSTGGPTQVVQQSAPKPVQAPTTPPINRPRSNSSLPNSSHNRPAH